VLASRVRDWVVMTDELEYAKLATHIGQTLSPVPTLRGQHVSIYSMLYPALISPFYGLLSAPHAFRAAHVVNGILFASASIPAYLLARKATLSERWSLLVAFLSVALPWNVQSGFVMTESAAYAAFLWAMLATLRAVEKPSPRRDLVAIAAIAVAVVARTQFVALGLVFVITALVYERRGHRVLAVATVGALVVAAIGGSRLLGSYSVTAKRWPFPWKAFEDAGAHLDVIGIGLGLLPLLIGGAWLIAGALRRDPFALLAVVTTVVLVLETSSYDARFGGGPAPIRERYVFYVAPLLLVATARALAEREIPRVPLVAMTVFVAVTVFAYDFPRFEGVHVDAASGVLDGLIRDAGGAAFVAVLAVVLTLILLLAPKRPGLLAAATVVLVVGATVATTATVWTRLLTSRSPSSRAVSRPPTVVLDWIDRVLPKGSHVAMIPYSSYPYWGPNALLWWDVEFWNRTVDDAYVMGDTWDYAPFPHRELHVDPATGVVAGTQDAPAYVVAAAGDPRIQLVAKPGAFSNYGLNVIHVDRPYRARFVTTGLDPDGWTTPDRPARIHVFGGGSEELTLQRADNSSTSMCVTGEASLPNDPTGEVPVAPLTPTSTGTRPVGVRVADAGPRSSC
jgi:hypothetical protein